MKFQKSINPKAFDFNNRPVVLRKFGETLGFIDGNKVHRVRAVTQLTDALSNFSTKINDDFDSTPICLARCLLEGKVAGNTLSEFGWQKHRDLIKSLGVTIE